MDARKQGPFKNWDDLIGRVKGIAQTSAGKLSEEGLTVNGQAYKAGPASSSKPASTTEKSENLLKLQAKNKRRVEFLLYAYKAPALGGLFLSLRYIENPL